MFEIPFVPPLEARKNLYVILMTYICCVPGSDMSILFREESIPDALYALYD